MFTNYLKSAWRNLLKRKQIAFLNILGLAIGMAACLLIFQYINYEKSYDSFHPHLDQLYRLNLGMTNTGESRLDFRATNHPGAGVAAKRDFPEVESYARLVKVELFFGSAVLSYELPGEEVRTFYEENMYVADSAVLTMFHLPLSVGDPSTALEDPMHMVITESLAKRYFGEEDPMGKEMSINGGGPFVVNGIMEDPPENTHLKTSALISASGFSNGLNNAWIWPEFYTYLKLKPGTSAKDIEDQLDPFVDKYLGKIMEEYGIEEKMALQPVKDIHLGGNIMRELTENSSQKTISFLMVIAAIILIIAWVNYINLSTSRSLERATEVGVRKVIGAQKGSIVWQFLTEAALMNVLAIFLAVILVGIAAPYFNELVDRPVLSQSGFNQVWSQYSTWLIFLVMFIGGTLLAGLYPAFVLSSFRPSKTIKGHGHTPGQKFQFRHVLVVFQFAIGILMIAGTLIVFNQLSYMRSRDLGFNMDQLLVVKAPSIMDSTFMSKSLLYRDLIRQESHVRDMTISSDIPGHLIQNNNTIKRPEQAVEEGFFATYIATNEQFMPVYDIELLAGRNFSKEIPTDSAAVIINQKAMNLLGYQNPAEVIGKRVDCRNQGWSNYTIVGVTPNINHRSLAYEQEPMVFFNYPNIPIDYFSVKLGTQELTHTLNHLEDTFLKLFPNNPFEYFFLDEYFDEQYHADRKFGVIFSLFSGLAILVACLGLIGLAAHMTTNRTKETGIRKVLGASAFQILVLLGKQFVILVLIATVIAIPIAWYGGGLWLQNYAYRAQLSGWLFVAPVVLLLLISVAMVVWQSAKVVWSNPADAIRYE